MCSSSDWASFFRSVGAVFVAHVETPLALSRLSTNIQVQLPLLVSVLGVWYGGWGATKVEDTELRVRQSLTRGCNVACGSRLWSA